MLSYARGESAHPLIEETIGENLERTVAAHGGRDALVEVETGRRWTYTEFNVEVDRLAHGLMAEGVTKGDRVGILAPNCAEWVIVQYATAKIGALLVTINPAYRTHELAYALSHSGVSVLISAATFKTSDYRAMIEEVQVGTSLSRVVYLGSPGWQELLGHTGRRDDLAARMATLDAGDPINIQYTSGTTGSPKGATLSHRNILNNAFFTTEALNFTPADRLAVPVPFYHCFGMVLGNLGCTSHGAAIIIPGGAFDAAGTLRAIQDERCTAVYGVPTMFIAMLSLPELASHDLSTLRTGIMAGAPCPTEVMKHCLTEMHMAEVSICYGMTETSPVSCQTRIDDDLEHRTATIGRTHPHVEHTIDPDTGSVVDRGSPGELCTRGYSVMLGYWDDADRTAEVVDPDGWMHTGDLAVMRTDGYAQIVGRLKDMVLRGGENIYPREIEEFFYTHPDIEDVQIIGVPDEKYGEELCAWVKTRPGAAALSAEAVRTFATGKLAHYKIPRYVMVVDTFPTTITGKVRKVDMRAESIAALGLGDPEG